MNIGDLFVIPSDLTFIPLASLGTEEARKLDGSEGDILLTRRHGRAGSKVVGDDAAELLRLFLEPKTIVQAIIDYTTARKLDSETTLEDAFPLLHFLIESKFLLPAEVGDQHDGRPRLEAGSDIDGWTVERAINVLDDTEIYRVRRASGEPGALKIMRDGTDDATRTLLSREARILEFLDGRVGPRLLSTGRVEDRDFLLLNWHDGLVVANLAARIRAAGQGAELDRLCHAILTAYATLHGLDVIHADVHPGNILAASVEEVALLDFGLAVTNALDGLTMPARGAVAYFLEPEYARARLSGEPAPPATALSEQFSVAALLFQLQTGKHAIDLHPERKKLYQQLAEQAPRRFRDCGVPDRAAVEDVLRRALSKDPSDRFPGMTDFRRAFAAAIEACPHESSARHSSPVASRDDHAAAEAWQHLERFAAAPGPSSLASVGLKGAPTASVNFGAAGVAYLCYRAAMLGDSPVLLAHADLWVTRGLAESGRYDAFYDEHLGITPETVGTVSLYHTQTGLHCVRGLIAHARGDMVSLQSALDDYTERLGERSEQIDLALGQAGVLLGAAILHDAAPQHPLIDVGRLETAARVVRDELWRWLGGLGRIRQQSDMDFLGMAHGFAGVMYALLQWSDASGDEPPRGLRSLLRELGDMARHQQSGLVWPRKISSRSDTMPGWCNGSAGFVFLWTSAARILREREWMQLAEGAALDTYGNPDPATNLCCGLAGRGYALLNMYRATNDAAWLERAAELGVRVHRPGVQRSLSLYKGDAGPALLAAELQSPEIAAMPLFELERWRELARH